MSDTALLIIDVQLGNFTGADPIFQGEKLLSKTLNLIEKARSNGVPVIYVQHNGKKGGTFEPNTELWKIHPMIAALDDDIIVQKHTPDSFHETTLIDVLEKLGAKKLIIAGLQTEYCIDTTTRRAFSLGYNVSLVSDAHSTWDSTVSAKKIIDHHNLVLGDWFATLVQESEVIFSQS